MAPSSATVIGAILLPLLSLLSGKRYLETMEELLFEHVQTNVSVQNSELWWLNPRLRFPSVGIQLIDEAAVFLKIPPFLYTQSFLYNLDFPETLAVLKFIRTTLQSKILPIQIFFLLSLLYRLSYLYHGPAAFPPSLGSLLLFPHRYFPLKAYYNVILSRHLILGRPEIMHWGLG